MIQSGLLTHGVPQNQLLVWHPSSLVFNGILTALVTTILSYQVAGIVLDLCLGTKRAGKSRISDIQTVLLVRSPSPIAVLYSLFPRLRSFREGTSLPQASVGSNSSNALRFQVAFKLLFLLAIVPLINMATIIFNLESTMWLTFGDAKFGGLGLGVNPDLSIQPFETSSAGCKRAIFVAGEGEDVLSDFFRCERFPSAAEIQQSFWTVAVAALSQNTVRITVQSPTSIVVTGHQAFVLVRGLGLADPDDERNGIPITYQVQQVLTNQSAEKLVDYGLQLVEEACRKQEGTTEFQTIATPYSFAQFGGRASVTKRMNCRSVIPDDPESGGALRIRDELSKRIAFVESPRFRVRLGNARDNEPLVSGKDLLLLRRRRSYVSLPILSILTLAIIILRVIIGRLTSNDIERGIGLILRQGLGLRCCDSMLASSNVTANYEDEREVTRFRSDS